MERRFAKDSPGRSNPWMKDPTARAWLLETMNNRPAYAYAAAKGTLRRTSGQELSREAFLAVLESEILGAYEARDERVKGEHIIGKIPRAVPSGGPAVTTVASTPIGSRRPAAGAKSTELVGEAATVLPPGRAAAGPDVVSAIGSAGLVPAALRLLVAAGHGDTNALTNIAFWAAHPDLFGTKLQPSQPNFAQLSAEWIRLRDGIVRAAHSTADTRQTAPHLAAVHTARTGNGPRRRGRCREPAASGRRRIAGRERRQVLRAGRRPLPRRRRPGENAGKVRVWLYGSSGANVCNMTSLTMGLVSMAGEDEVRARMIGLLRTAACTPARRCRSAASSWTSPRRWTTRGTSARIRTLDLVTAVAIGRHGSYKSVTDAGTIARVARDAGIATKARRRPGSILFSDPRVRAKAAQMLADRHACDRRHGEPLRLSDRGPRRRGRGSRPGRCPGHARAEGLPVRARRRRCGHRGGVPQDGRRTAGRCRAPRDHQPRGRGGDQRAAGRSPGWGRRSGPPRCSSLPPPIPSTSRPAGRTSTRPASSRRTTCACASRSPPGSRSRTSRLQTGRRPPARRRKYLTNLLSAAGPRTNGGSSHRPFTNSAVHFGVQLARESRRSTETLGVFVSATNIVLNSISRRPEILRWLQRTNRQVVGSSPTRPTYRPGYGAMIGVTPAQSGRWCGFRTVTSSTTPTTSSQMRATFAARRKAVRGRGVRVPTRLSVDAGVRCPGSTAECCTWPLDTC